MNTYQTQPGDRDWFSPADIGRGNTVDVGVDRNQIDSVGLGNAQVGMTSGGERMPGGSPEVEPVPRSAWRNGVAVQVHTTDGWPVSSAVLTVTDLAGQQVARVPADQDGCLVTDSLPSGTYTAIITAIGFAPSARTAVVTGSGSAQLVVVSLARVNEVELPPPGVWTIDPAHSTINLTARHIGIASIRGRFAEFGGQLQIADPPERSTVSARIQAASIDTGNKTRDDHLRSADFLNADIHPTIEYIGRGITSLGGEKWRLDGELTLNAITRPVVMELTYLGAGGDPWGGMRAAFRAVTDLRRDDFEITYNQILRAGIDLIGTTVLVELNIEAVQGEVAPVL